MEKIKRSIAPLLMLAAVLMSMMLCPMAVSADDSTMTVVSDTDTVVTAGNFPPNNAVLAWTHPSWSSVDHVFSNNAKWIWESERVQQPVTGDIVEFEKEFIIPGSPTAGTMYITCDNGYELRINGTPIGTVHLGAGWKASNLTESFVHTSGWQGVETWNITDELVSGLNIVEISTANEYMGPQDGQDNGTIDSNPAGLIFEIAISYDEGVPPPPPPPPPPPIEVGGFVYPVNKIALLAPWIALAVVIATSATVMVRRRQGQN
jgi:hypothetical protein